MSQQAPTIAHLPATPYTVLRLDYLIICQGDYCAAKILSLFEAWSESKQDAIAQAKYHNRAAAKEGEAPTQDESTWLYNTLENIRQRVLGEYSVKTINKALKALEELGWVKTRFNPARKWDRTKQYQFQTQAVQGAIYQIAPEQIEKYIAPSAETLDFLHLVKVPNAFGKSSKSKRQIYQMDLVKVPNDLYKESYKESHKESQTEATKIESCVRVEKNNLKVEENERESGLEPPQELKAENPSASRTEVSNGKEDSAPSLNSDGAMKRNAKRERKEVGRRRKSGARDEATPNPSNQPVISNLENIATDRSPRPPVTPSPHPSSVANLKENGIKERSRSSRGAASNRSEFEGWKQQLAAEEWEAFLSWKASQAPSEVRDRRGWAYNTLKANIERARLSFESFQEEKAKQERLDRSDASGTGTPDFSAWSRERHVEVVGEYLADSVGFLRSRPWHKDWVEFVNAHLPDLFASASRDPRAP